MVSDPADKTPRDPEPRHLSLRYLLSRLRWLEHLFEARDQRIHELTVVNRELGVENHVLKERFRTMQMWLKIVTVLGAVILYTLLAVAGEVLPQLALGPYPITGVLLGLAMLAIVVLTARDWWVPTVVVPAPAGGHAPPAPHPPAPVPPVPAGGPAPHPPAPVPPVAGGAPPAPPPAPPVPPAGAPVPPAPHPPAPGGAHPAPGGHP